MTRLSEVSFGSARPVEGYGPGFWRAGGEVIRGPMLITAAFARAWGGLDDTAPLLALAGEVDVLFIGTGAAMSALPRGFADPFDALGIGVEPMDSRAAARTYNVLLGEGRRIAAALLPVG